MALVLVQTKLENIFMAILLYGLSRCPICDGVINEGDRLVSTSHFIGDWLDPLSKYSDAAMHKSCFLNWDMRERFVARYNEVIKS